MFDFLRKKIGGFVDSILKKEEKTEQKPSEEAPAKLEVKAEELKKETATEKTTEKIEELKQEKPAEKALAAPIEVLEKKHERKTEEKTFAPKLGFFKQITSIFSNQIELKENEINPALEELELSLLESDASIETANFIVSNLRSQLSGQKVERKKLSEFVNNCIRSTLGELLSASSPSTGFFSLVEQRKQSEPFIVLFVGPNGAGKTTTIAKIAFQLKQRGITSVIAAADTFRAAAIQQAEHHGKVIGVKVVKHDYGADPAAVAFDAIAHAKAHNIDVVLIDTAGRQETNVNLVAEMQKLTRVVKPNLKLFVGESLAGHSVIEQVKKFHSAITLDGIILSKLDCDAKGGNALSIANDTKIPIYFVGMGQEYADLVEFTPPVLLNRILAAS